MSGPFFLGEATITSRTPAPLTTINMYTLQRKTSGPYPSTPQAPASPHSSPGQQLNSGSLRGGHLHSPTAGKSGQFIERLQNENASLRREYNVERSTKEEAQKGLSVSKTIVAKLESENSRLELLQSTNVRALERKTRKIDELQAVLTSEAERRRKAEEREQQMATELDRTHEETNKNVAEAFTLQKRAEAHADALRDGLHRLEAHYKKQLSQLSAQLREVQQREEEDRRKLVALDIVSDLRQQEMARANNLVVRMRTTMKSYEECQKSMFSNLETEADQMRSKAQHVDKDGERLIQDLEDTRDKMKWTMSMNALQQQQDG